MSVDVLVERPVNGRRTGLELVELLTTLDAVRRTQPVWCDLTLDEILVATGDVTVQFESWDEGLIYLRSLTTRRPSLVHLAWTPNTSYATYGVARIVCRLNSHGKVWVGHSNDQAAAVGMAQLLAAALEDPDQVTASPSLSKPATLQLERRKPTSDRLRHPVIACLVLPAIGAIISGVVLKIFLG